MAKSVQNHKTNQYLQNKSGGRMDELIVPNKKKKITTFIFNKN